MNNNTQAHRNKTTKPTGDDDTKKLSWPIFHFTRNGWSVFSSRKATKQLKESDVAKQYEDAMNFLVSDVAKNFPNQHLPMTVYSECRRCHDDGNTYIYRSTPSYRSGEAWTDWVYADILGEGQTDQAIIDKNQPYSKQERTVHIMKDQRFDHAYMHQSRPVQIHGFITMPPIDHAITISDYIIIQESEEPLNYLIGTPLKLNPIVAGGLQHRSSTIQYWSMKSSHYCLILCDNMLHPCLVIPDYNVKHELNSKVKKSKSAKKPAKQSSDLEETGTFTVIGPPEEWSNCFLALAKDYSKAGEDTDEIDIFD
jgi:hypothetical protein